MSACARRSAGRAQRSEKAMRTLPIFALTLASIVVAAGCGSAPKAQPVVGSSAMNNAVGPTATARQDIATPTSGSVRIDPRIAQACGDLPETHFAFDSARVQSNAADALDALARCFSTGPLKGKSMRLIGHTDPRGEVEYNLGLGQRRAGSVAGYLGGHGLSNGAMATSSRGEQDATGTDEQGWARDRRVDIMLAN
jgi:peptidoglycan-associated lipoprotein